MDRINLKSKGVVPVAILTTPFFDAKDVDISSVIFAGAKPVKNNLEDANKKDDGKETDKNNNDDGKQRLGDNNGSDQKQKENKGDGGKETDKNKEKNDKEGKNKLYLKDVDHDGDKDLLLYFDTQSLKLSPADTIATLTGQALGQPIKGTDSIKIVPNKKTSFFDNLLTSLYAFLFEK